MQRQHHHRLSVSSTSSSLISDHDHGGFRSRIQSGGDDGVGHAWEVVIPRVICRYCQPGTDWTSARARRIHRLVLIVLPSLPLLVAAVASAVYLQHRYVCFHRVITYSNS